jgi:hypothetical protein
VPSTLPRVKRITKCTLRASLRGCYSTGGGVSLRLGRVKDLYMAADALVKAGVRSVQMEGVMASTSSLSKPERLTADRQRETIIRPPVTAREGGSLSALAKLRERIASRAQRSSHAPHCHCMSLIEPLPSSQRAVSSPHSTR